MVHTVEDESSQATDLVPIQFVSQPPAPQDPRGGVTQALNAGIKQNYHSPDTKCQRDVQEPSAAARDDQNAPND